MVFNHGTENAALSSSLNINQVELYDALILQLGSFTPYPLFSGGKKLKRGDVIQCHLYSRYGTPQVSYILIPTELNIAKLPLPVKRFLVYEKELKVDEDTGSESGEELDLPESTYISED